MSDSDVMAVLIGIILILAGLVVFLLGAGVIMLNIPTNPLFMGVGIFIGFFDALLIYSTQK